MSEKTPMSMTWDQLADMIRVRFEVEITPKQLQAICGELPDGNSRSNEPWSESTWLMWFKNRLAHHGYFHHSGRYQIPGSTAVLHVFLLYVEETPEMLERLRKEKTTEEAKPARSRITDTLEVITPIDATAARVVPQE